MNHGHPGQSPLTFDQSGCVHNGYQYLIYTYENKHNTAFQSNRQGRLRYSEPIVSCI